SAGVDFDFVADVAEQGNSDFHARVGLGGLEHLARGVALDGGFGVDDFAHNNGGQRYRDGAAVVEHDFHGHALFQVVQRIAHAFGFDFVLVVLFVHEYIHGVGIVRVGAFSVFKHDVFEFFVRLVNRFAALCGPQSLDFDLYDGRVAARFVVFSFLDDERVAADHHDVAYAQFLCGFHRFKNSGGSSAPPGATSRAGACLTKPNILTVSSPKRF